MARVLPWIAALFVLLAGSVEFPEPAPEVPEGCEVTEDGEIDCPPTTCDECRTDAECEALCPEVEV